MATIKQTLDELMTLDGAMCAAVVDSASGMMLGSVGTGVEPGSRCGGQHRSGARQNENHAFAGP